MDNPDDAREAPANPSRRRILAGGIAATAGAVASPVLAQVKPLPGAPAINRNLPDVGVIGAGAFGGWTALSLREAGAKVTLVDVYGPGTPRASSGDESRLLSLSYGGREIYKNWASCEQPVWEVWPEECGRRTFRSEECRGGDDGGSTFSSRWCPEYYN